MAEVADNKLELPAMHRTEINSIAEVEEEAATEAEKAGAEQKKISNSVEATYKMDKLDELSSLEQEIAKMHNIQTECNQIGVEADQLHAGSGSSAANGSGSGCNDAQLGDEMAQGSRHCTPIKSQELKEEPTTQTPLEELDLIALLKGTDQEQEVDKEREQVQEKEREQVQEKEREQKRERVQKKELKKDQVQERELEGELELKQELKQEQKQERELELKKEQKKQQKGELQQELKKELQQELKKELKLELKKEQKKEQKKELKRELKKEQSAETLEPKSSIELALAELDNVGVTIEGEGQYEIMEIDDTSDNNLASALSHRPLAPPSLSKTGAKYATSLGKAKLSPEQARAVALEQMADLTAQKARRRDTPVPKQSPQQSPQKSQQPSPQQSPPLDIINTLNDDWNEYDSASDNSVSNSSALTATKRSTVKKSTPTESNQYIGSVKVVLKSITQKQQTVDKLKPALEQTSSNVEPTGFKRTRIIKRKIIWDPDVPETQKSFAQYASTKIAKTTTAAATTAAAAAAAATATTAAGTTVAKTIAATAATKANNLETVPKKARPMTPKEPPLKAAAKRAATPSKLLESRAVSPPKRRAQTPSVLPNGAAAAKKKKITEIDKLMGDEGAANMMQAVEREQRELSGGELANKPCMRKRSLTLSGRVLKTAAIDVAEVTATTTKKDSPKASKRAGGAATTDVDAVFTKSKNARPSAAWDYVYKQRASEESMIMRRRSNSSYSSNASASRPDSLDTKPAAVANLSDTDATDVPTGSTDPSFKFLKPETKSNQRSDDAAAPQQTLAHDMKRGVVAHKEPKPKAELVTLHKLEKVAHLVINLHQGKIGHTYKLQLLQKLTEMLNKLDKSNDCNTVLLSVQGSQFCQGIVGQELVGGTPEKRKNSATQMALAIKSYLRTLATFHKPLVAGIVGSLKNLGVMQLPLFDYVVAADDSSFETTYAKMGQTPEGYAFWNKHPKVSSQVHSRLFLLGERLQATDLAVPPNCLIDKCCKARSVNDEALVVAKHISSTTAEHYHTLKKLDYLDGVSLLQRLDKEFKMINEQWSSNSFLTAYYKRVDI